MACGALRDAKVKRCGSFVMLFLLINFTHLHFILREKMKVDVSLSNYVQKPTACGVTGPVNIFSLYYHNIGSIKFSSNTPFKSLAFLKHDVHLFYR